MAKKYEEALRRGIGAAPPAEYDARIIPADAEGNNATIDVQPGRHTLDFHLKPPAPGSPR